MARVQTNGVELEYDTFGDPADPPLLLVMGLGAQMILWHDDFCRALADRGFHVVRFDNRDVGMSTKLDDAGIPNIFAALQAAMTGQTVDAPYTLDDMADDVVGLMEALDVPRAHVVGASMGGMIAQTLACRHPDRVLTLTSIMSTTGDPSLPPARADAMQVLLLPPPTTREESIERALHVWRVIGSPGFDFDEANVRDFAGRSFDRGISPGGVARQFAAILASGNRTDRLACVTVPTLVIHGDQDPLVTIEGGRATAKAVKGAELLVIEGMGHDLPRGAWERMIDAIARHTARAEAAPAAASA